MTKMKIKTLIGLIIILMSIFGYLNLYQLNSCTKIENVSALPVATSLESNDILIDITKNATAIGPNSVIEFSVEVTNNLSESLYDVSANITEMSDGLTINPSVEPLFTVSSLDPESTSNFQFVTEFSENSSSNPVDVVLMIDASGSMQDEIDNVKAELNDLISNLTHDIPDLRMGVIVFGWNVYDEYPTEDTHNYLELTNDFVSIKALINSLVASGGKEPWGDALYLASTWDWRVDAAKLLILVGDEDCDPGIYVGYEMLGSDPSGFYNGSDLVNIVSQLNNQGVIISTVICGDADSNTVNQFEWIAAYTEGTSVYLPDLELEGISLPGIIEEWTLELGREYSLFFNLTVSWKNDMDTVFHNSRIETFWLDFTPPSVIISKSISPTGFDLFSVEFFIDVDDVSPIGIVTLYHNASGSITSEILTPIENTSYFSFTLQDVPGGLNISYFVKSSDILKNSAFTPVFWVIAEPKFDEFGEEVSFLVEANKTIYTNLKIGQTGTYYFILSGISELEQITMSLTVQTTNVTVSPVQTKRPVISSSYGHKIIQFNLGPGDHAVTLSVPSNLGNFTVSYVWLDLAHPVNTRFTGPMTNLIRVYALEWEATNGTYFSFDHPAGSPLVLRAEVYNSSWDLVSTFIVGGSLMVSTTGSYYILVWATKHEGEFTIQLTEDSPTTSDDPYYTYTEENTRTNDGASAGMSIFQFISAMILLSILTTNFRKKKKK